MVTPSGTISIGNVSTELGAGATSTRSLNDTSTRNLAGVSSGAISLDNLRNKSAGSLSLTPLDPYDIDFSATTSWTVIAATTGSVSSYTWTVGGGGSWSGQGNSSISVTSPSVGSGASTSQEVSCTAVINGTSFVAYTTLSHERF